MKLRLGIAFVAGIACTFGALSGLAYYVGNSIANSFTTTKPGTPLP